GKYPTGGDVPRTILVRHVLHARLRAECGQRAAVRRQTQEPGVVAVVDGSSAELDFFRLLFEREPRQYLPALEMLQEDRALVAAGHDRVATRKNANGRNEVIGASKRALMAPAGSVPDVDASIPAGRNEFPAVRRVGNTDDVSVVTRPVRDALSRRRIPQGNDRAARRQQSAAVRGEAQPLRD